MRISTKSAFQRVLRGMNINMNKLVINQEQVSSGRRILRPSDDPTGTSRALSFSRRIANTERYISAIQDGRVVLDTASSQLETGSSILADARELMIQGMNGTLSQADRESIASELELLRDQMLEVANTRSGDRYLFGGTLTGDSPWSASTIGGFERASYAGNFEEQLLSVGQDATVAINVAGADIFAKNQFSGVEYAGLTGISSGTTADQGTGYEYLEVSHDGTTAPGLAAAGVALAGGGANDTFLGDETLVIDVTAGTAQLGGGPVLPLPTPGSPDESDYVLENSQGGEIHLDLTGWSGADLTTTVSGAGSISIDGSTWTALDFTDPNLELIHPGSGNVLHVDTTGIGRSGKELAQFGGAVNVFDMLEGVVSDLRNGDGLDAADLVDRLELGLGELDRNHENLLVGTGALGSRSSRLSNSELRMEGALVQLSSVLSDTVDADFIDVVTNMTEAEQTLQLAQQTGLRLIQTNLMRFL